MQLKHCIHSSYSSVFVMTLNNCVLIGFLGDMFIRLASKNENSRNENFEREDRFKEGANSVRHFVEFGVIRRYFAVP